METSFVLCGLFVYEVLRYLTRKSQINQPPECGRVHRRDARSTGSSSVGGVSRPLIYTSALTFVGLARVISWLAQCEAIAAGAAAFKYCLAWTVRCSSWIFGSAVFYSLAAIVVPAFCFALLWLLQVGVE